MRTGDPTRPTSWPPSAQGGAGRSTPRGDSPTPIEGRGFQILSFSPKGNGMRQPMPDGSPSAQLYDGPIKIGGSAVYVVDCPLGWPGKLQFDEDREYGNLHPGMLIPDRYQKFLLTDHPAEDAPPFADCPIILAVGERAGEYRRTGWRLHWWNNDTIKGAGSAVLPGNTGEDSELIYIRGYDFFTLWYSPRNGGTAKINPYLKFTNSFAVSEVGAGELGLMAASSTRQIQIPGGSDVYHPIYEHGVHRQYHSSVDGYGANYVGSITSNASRPSHFGGFASFVRFAARFETGSTGSMEVDGHAASAGIHVGG